MPVQIKFGTSGWRAVMAEDFTFANVRRATEGVARYVAAQKPQQPEGRRVVVGRDPRFLGEAFVDMAAKILVAHGITPLVIAEPAPTPAIAFEVRRAQTDGAINFTASHNPAEYNGIKFSTPDGAPALPDVTRQIEAAVEAYDRGPDNKNISVETGLAPSPIEVKSHYLARIREVVDLAAIKKAGLKVAYDPLWGAGRGYPDSALREAGVDCATIHDYRDVLFGGHAPEPDGEFLNDLRAAMKKTGAHLGISTDGDADRFGILDRDGAFISPNYVIALLFDFLVETRGWKNGVAKSVVTTDMVTALAKKFDVPLYETPVGFKYIGELIQQDKIAVGGEESAGLSIRHHVPEKDGVLAGLLCCEMVARRGQSLGEQLRRLFDQVGSFYPERQNFRLTPEVKEKLTGKLKQEPREFAGRKVASIVRTDGLKLVLEDGAWVCYRLSGTEPVARVYTEARSDGDRAGLGKAAMDWIFS